MELGKNYYQILGLDKNATTETIKKKYRELAKKYHPDRNPDDKQAEEKFKAAAEAYEILTEKRDEYDHLSPHGKHYQPNRGGFGNFHFSSSGGDMGFEEFHTTDPREIWEIFRNRGRRREPSENLNIQYKIDVTLADIYQNKKFTIKYKRKEPCKVCGGSGFDHSKGEAKECPTCSGTGRLHGVLCSDCAGQGLIFNHQCEVCQGKKLVEKEVSFQLENIYNLQGSHQRIMQGYGHHSQKYPTIKVGNLILVINFIPDDRYEVTQHGLMYHLDLHYEDAIIGSHIEYKHLDNKNLKLKIPKGTKDGALIRLPDKGLLLNKQDRMPLVFRVNIIIDYNRVKNEK